MYDGRNIFTKTKVMIEEILKPEIEKCLAELYSATDQSIQFQKTRKDFEGDVTLIVFPLLRASRKGPEPTAEEIAAHLGKPVKQVSAMLNINDRVGSVDNCLGPDSDTTLLETIPDTATQGPENTLVDSNLMTNMEQWLDLLTDLQKDVISRRFGLRGHSVCTLEHVGKDINLTRERVRQIQVGALRSLRKILETEGLNSTDVLDAKL